MKKRTHLVMVPGFGGFDGLGSIRYYAGVTKVFRELKKKENEATVLHYFDNLPTASVGARAKELRGYLTRRVGRGEFQEGDEIVLIGHSTGGLDIRQLLRDLKDAPDKRKVDASGVGGVPVDSEDLRKKIKRVVFISVPQHGTNIADFVRVDESLRRQLFGFIATSFGLSFAEDTLRAVANREPSDVLRAIDDVRVEIAKKDSKDENEASNARHVEADVALWFENTHQDFLAIEDLAVGGRPGRLVNDSKIQDSEIANWMGENAIQCRSYATVVDAPSTTTASARRSLLVKLLKARKYVPDTDAIFRLAHAACADGPLNLASFTAQKDSWIVPPPSDVERTITNRDSDGIVNTLSMMWPDRDKTKLVFGDHADVIGHFQPLGPQNLSDTSDDKRPRDMTYDLLQSLSKFDNGKFEHVWRDILSFAIRGEGPLE